jgi:hypothetical protein
MSKWQYTKGLHDLADGCYLQPDGSWGFSNAGRPHVHRLSPLGR